MPLSCDYDCIDDEYYADPMMIFQRPSRIVNAYHAARK